MLYNVIGEMQISHTVAYLMKREVLFGGAVVRLHAILFYFLSVLLSALILATIFMIIK
jgi:hypothetical protein